MELNNDKLAYKEDDIFINKVIKEFLECFFAAIKNTLLVARIPAESERFCDKYNAEFERISIAFKKCSQYFINLTIDTEYNAFIKRTYSLNLNSIGSFETSVVSDYLSLLADYCNAKKYKSIPECFKIVLLVVSRKFISDQNLYKYCRDLSVEAKEEILNFTDVVNNIAVDFKKEVNKVSETTKQEISETEKTATERSVTILGIFSAIVLTFNAGVSFSSIVLENLISSSIYRAILITLIFGLILGNVIIGLFAYLESMQKKPDRAKKKRSKVKWAILGLNLLLLFLMWITVHLWYDGFVEERNVEISTKYGVTATDDEAQITLVTTDD